MPESVPEVTIYTDGGADPNPGPGGWGAVLLHEASGTVRELSGGEPMTTNNRMELTAAIRALEALKDRCRADVVTDSIYLKKGVTEWLPGWIARGWRRKTGELQNEDLWRRLAELVERHQVRWRWIKGHAGHQWNERADRLATAAIRALRGPAAPVRADAHVLLRVSCAGGTGGRGAWAALVRRGGEERTLSGALDRTTSNALDVVGAATALESLPEGISVAVATGSGYLRDGATRWLPAWKRKGWRTQTGEPVKNRDLWERLEAAMARRRVVFREPTAEDAEAMKALGEALRGAREAGGGRHGAYETA